MRLVQFFIFDFFTSFLMLFSHLFFGLPSGRVNIGFHLYTFFTILSSGIRCKWPNQLNLCAFMWFIIFLCLINSSNSSFVLILHVPSLYFVGPKFDLNTFRSVTINLFFIVSLKTQLTVPQLVKTFTAFYWNRKLITVFTKAQHVSLPRTRSIQSMPSQNDFFKIHFNIILPSTPRSSKCKFPHQHTICNSFLPHPRRKTRPSNSSWSPGSYLLRNYNYKAPHCGSLLHSPVTSYAQITSSVP